MPTLEEKLQRIAAETAAYRPKEKTFEIPAAPATVVRSWSASIEEIPFAAPSLPLSAVSLLLPDSGEEWELEKTVFLDTETTGLSGSVGTLAFLAGLGYYKNGSFTVEQYFMEDYDREPELLESLAEKLKGFEYIVTYNGKSFDVPILNSRSVMNRVRFRAERLEHIDLLYACRRLFKRRLRSCGLQNMEKHILGQERTGDIPGAMAPLIFFEYLKSGDMEAMEGIIAHNRQDIVSLYSLLCALCGYIAQPHTLAFPEDRLSLGMYFESADRFDEALACYHSAWELNESVCAYGFLEKRRQNSAQAVQAWETLIARNSLSCVPYVELAKYYEHTCKACKDALDIVDLCLIRGATADEEPASLKKRRARLVKKLEKLGGNNP